MFAEHSLVKRPYLDEFFAAQSHRISSFSARLFVTESQLDGILTKF